MNYITVDSDIRVLKFTTGTYNSLKRAHINTVGELLEHDADSLMCLPMIGTIKVREATLVMDQLRSGTSDDFVLVDSREKQIRNAKLQKESAYLDGWDLEMMNLSNRAYYALRRNGFTMVREIAGMTEKELMHLNMVGVKGAKEINSALEVIRQIAKCMTAEEFRQAAAIVA